MVHHGKTHLQAMGAVMSHLGARIMAVLWEGRPYELRDTQGNLITKKEAMELIQSEYKVPEETRQARRRHNLTGGGSLVAERARQLKLLSLDHLYLPPKQCIALKTYNQ